ncbi:hypothetical protein D3C72_2447250 [compost metagenome]
MEADSSDIVVSHIRIAADMIDAFMAGRITLKNVISGDTPRLIDASSIESGMLNSTDDALRTANGSRRTV